MRTILIIILFAICLAACRTSASRVNELEGTRWRIQALEGQEILEDTFLTISFKEGKISGSAGCNRFGASYTIRSGGNLSIEMPYRQLQLCYEPVGVMQQEDRFIEIFNRVAKFRVAGDQLSFLDGRGNILLLSEQIPQFDVNPDDLAGKSWQLESATGINPGNVSKFTLHFEAGEFFGTTICRDFRGRYQAVGDFMQILYMEMTSEINCDETLALEEGWFTTMLGETEQYNVSASRLELYTMKGKKLVFLAKDGD